MDENFIKNIFQTVLGESVQVKVIRDRNSGYVHLFLEHIPKPCNTLPTLCNPSGCPTSLCLQHLHLTLTSRVLFPTPVFNSPTTRY
jgi:hypothetical protein